MNFAYSAAKLSGQVALLLGWRPDEFWNATPAELDCILAAMAPEKNLPPDNAAITKLMERFPDG